MRSRADYRPTPFRFEVRNLLFAPAPARQCADAHCSLQDLLAQSLADDQPQLPLPVRIAPPLRPFNLTDALANQTETQPTDASEDDFAEWDALCATLPKGVIKTIVEGLEADY